MTSRTHGLVYEVHYVLGQTPVRGGPWRDRATAERCLREIRYKGSLDAVLVEIPYVLAGNEVPA